ncbi:MAG: AI-2E family transporter [Clostridiales bacterium]|nr:AI-2E family transporter [Clostridiales bacterium]
MFDRQQLIRLKPLLIFAAAYTVFFFLFVLTFKYTFPLLAGFLLALLVQPLIRTLQKRLKLNPGPAAAISTLVAFLVLFGLLFLLGYWLVTEINNLLNYITALSSSKKAFNSLIGPINSLLNQAGEYLSKSKLDADFLKNNKEQILSILNAGTGVLDKVLNFLTSLPAIFTMFIVMIFSTYFFSKDMGAIKKHVVAFFSVRTARGLKTASRHGANMSGKWVCSYLLIYFITFLETLVVFYALGVPYPLVISIITGIADVLPVLGPGTIYIPLALIYLITGGYFKSAMLLVCWLLITAIRQVIEPKLVSSSINIHPLTMLAAIYFALIANNFWVLIYISSLALFYELLAKVELLPRLFLKEKEREPTEAEKKNNSPT